MRTRNMVIGTIASVALLAVICVVGSHWYGSRAVRPSDVRPSPPDLVLRPFAGTWVFTNGTATTDCVIKTDDGSAPSSPLVGKPLTFDLSDGKLWVDFGQGCRVSLAHEGKRATLDPPQQACKPKATEAQKADVAVQVTKLVLDRATANSITIASEMTVQLKGTACHVSSSGSAARSPTSTEVP